MLGAHPDRRRAIALVVAALAGAAADPDNVAAGPGASGRAVIAVLGDSIIEGAYLPRPEQQAVGPQLRAALSAAGVDPGGRGFIPAHPSSLSTVTSPDPSWPVRYTGRWAASTGPGGGAGSVLESRTEERGAQAHVRARGDEIVVLLGGERGVRALIRPGAGAAVVPAARTRGVLSATWVPTRRGASVTVINLSGPLALLGYLERRTPRAARQVEVSVMARGGARAADPIGRLDAAGLRALAPRLTVLALGTNDALAAAAGDAGALGRMSVGLTHLARRARRSGACAVLLPPRIARTRGVADELAARQRRVALAEGCRVLDVAEHALDGPGLRTSDGLHPSPAGAERLAVAIAPTLIGLRRLPPVQRTGAAP